MFEIDRTLAIIRPTQDYIDWLNEHIEADEEPITLDMLHEDCTCLLLPTFEVLDDAETYIRENFETIFKNELDDWEPEMAQTLDTQDYEAFSRLFEVEFHSMVFDMLTGDMSGHQFSTNTLQ